MRNLALIVILASVTLAGCVNRQAFLTNPTTGQQAYCTHSGWGWMGAPMAASAHRSCLESWRAQGFTTDGLSVAPRSSTIHPDLPVVDGWDLRLAKQKYRSGELSRVEFENIVQSLKSEYRAKVGAAKQEYKDGLISKQQYKQRVQEAKWEYAG
ncbi:hypothetical protein MT1_0605 [Pseudomonas sp. MT-1]|uniref:hypothetical protein n=1 Tax=Stutzerimonas stutzeri TaxID=316 RepID=UPI00053603AA|nr:hypothetical protein [Stutzerimonas stutzeri]MCQ4281968.1 hypothetical protein [Stutzerimonas stutzeri]BAP77781.1 hypothetical protein MT1_0605 [Pseudomonas sp. MT-1]